MSGRRAFRSPPGCVAVVAAACWLSIAPVRGEQAFVLDLKARSVTAVDLASLKPRESTSVSGTPDRALLSSDGSRIVVLSRGEGKATGSGFRPATKSTATVIETASGRSASRVELCWGLGSAVRGSDGASILVLCPGYDSKKPEDSRPSELVNLDLSTGEVRRSGFDRSCADFTVTPDGQMAILYFPRGKSPGAASGEVRFVALPSMEVLPNAAVKLRADYDEVFASPDGKTAYLFFRGLISFTEIVPGSLAAIALSERKLVKEYPLASAAVLGGFDADGRLYAATGKSESIPDAQLMVLQEGQTAATVKIRGFPYRIIASGEKGRVFVVHSKGVDRVDFGSFEGPPRQESTKVGLRFDSPSVITPDERRALVLLGSPEGCCRLFVLDLEQKEKLEAFTTGSFGARLGLGLRAAAATLASYRTAEARAAERGEKSFLYTLYGPQGGAPHSGSLVLRGDGRIGYAIDPQTAEVTVVDVDKAAKVRNIPAGSGPKELILLPGGELLAIVADSGVTLVDTKTQELVKQVKLEEVYGVIPTPDGKRVLVLGKKMVAILDASNAQIAAETSEFEQPIDVLFPAP